MRSPYFDMEFRIVAMAGLPGSGKSALARELARRLDSPVFDKDAVRVELFGSAVDYSSDQDDHAMEELYARVDALARGGGRGAVIDGRTYTRRAHVERLRALAERLGASLTIVECVCAPEVARARIESDLRTGAHPARNRTPKLHDDLSARAEPIDGEKLVVDTSASPPAELARRIGGELARRG